MGAQLFAQNCGRFPILILSRNFVKQQKTATCIDVVEVVIGSVIRADRSISIDEIVEAFLNETEVMTITSTQPNSFESFEHHAVFVRPSGGSTCVAP